MHINTFFFEDEEKHMGGGWDGMGRMRKVRESKKDYFGGGTSPGRGLKGTANR